MQHFRCIVPPFTLLYIINSVHIVYDALFGQTKYVDIFDVLCANPK